MAQQVIALCVGGERGLTLYSQILITHHLISNYEKIFNSICSSLMFVSCETNTVEVSKTAGSGLCLAITKGSHMKLGLTIMLILFWKL